MRDLLHRMEVTQEQENDSMKKPTNDIALLEQPLPHPLEHKWTLWYYENDKSKDWLDNLHEVHTFHTVEDFWCLFNNIKSVGELNMGNDYSLFKEGIRPMWEDPRNKKGGRWLFNVESKYKTNLQDFWLDLLLYMIGESFEEYSDEICGAFVNVRKTDKISLWTANSDKREEVLAIGKKMKHECLRLTSDTRIVYETHLDSQTKQASRAKCSHII